MTMFDLDRLAQAEQALRRLRSGDLPPAPTPVQTMQPAQPRQCPFHTTHRQDEAA
jgi:hypothetical protein